MVTKASQSAKCLPSLIVAGMGGSQPEVRLDARRDARGILATIDLNRVQPRLRHRRPRADDRCTLDAILYVLRTGCTWRDPPEKYGDDSTGAGSDRRTRPLSAHLL
jgi:transposase